MHCSRQSPRLDDPEFLALGAPHPWGLRQPPSSLPVTEGHPGQLLSAEQGCCWKLKRESFGLDKGPISQGTHGSQDLKAVCLEDTGAQPLHSHISWRHGQAAPPSYSPHSWAGISLLTVRWHGSLPQTARAEGQAALRPCSWVPASPLPPAFAGQAPRGCGKPTHGPRGARETAEGAAAGKSQVKGWRRPVVGRSAFSHEEPLVPTPQESELSKKRKKCESLEQEARKKQRRCEELVSSRGPPRGQPGGGLPLSSAFTLLVLRGSPVLFGAGSRWGRKTLSGRAGSSVWGEEGCRCQTPAQSSPGLSGTAAERSPE